MKQSTSRRLIASLVTAFLLSQSALAQPIATPSPAGSWNFATQKMPGGCTLSGSMTVTQKLDRTLTCAFKANWACDAPLPKAVHTEQSCTAKQTGADIVITSRMEKVGPVDPPQFAETMRESYAADHFRVKINTRGDQMDGLFHSNGRAPVVFRKHLELIG